MLLEGKIAIVTAAAGAGIGQAIAELFAREGARVAVSDVHERRTEAAVERLRLATGAEVRGYRMDVTDEAEVDRVIEQVVSEMGQLDILVNNAGFNQPQPIWEMETQVWSRVLDVCLKGTFFCTRAALRHMLPRASGCIINIASMAGWNPKGADGQAHYAAAKAGVMGFTRAVAAEVASRGIRVNAIAPGFIPNPFLSRIYSAEHLEERRRAIPMGRPGEPMDVARVALFLASSLAGYMTGEVLSVTGGLYMHA